MGKTVLIVDDHAGFRASARLVLEADGFDVLGEARDGRSAIDAVRRLGPEVVLLDMRLPDMDGAAVARALARETPAPEVVLTSSHDAADFGEAIARSGACGFVPKGEVSGATVEALVAPQPPHM